MEAHKYHKQVCTDYDCNLASGQSSITPLHTSIIKLTGYKRNSTSRRVCQQIDQKFVMLMFQLIGIPELQDLGISTTN